MLKLVENSRAKKTEGIAVTYRAGTGEKYATCPATCSMNNSGKGAASIDENYLNALIDAVPRKGLSFTYSHFDYAAWGNKLKKGKTVINYSADTLSKAREAFDHVPTVVVLDVAAWSQKKSILATDSPTVIRCPAEYREGFSCRDCGNGEPLCARLDRDFIVGFTAHGASKKKAADPDTRGGCYADGGNVRLHWEATSRVALSDEIDGEKLKRFAAFLPPRTILRHHVAGDIGLE